jgi:hypothetical protein
VLTGPPGIVAGDLRPDLPKPVDRSSVAFFEWKRRLTRLLAGQVDDSELVREQRPDPAQHRMAI